MTLKTSNAHSTIQYVKFPRMSSGGLLFTAKKYFSPIFNCGKEIIHSTWTFLCFTMSGPEDSELKNFYHQIITNLPQKRLKKLNFYKCTKFIFWTKAGFFSKSVVANLLLIRLKWYYFFEAYFVTLILRFFAKCQGIFQFAKFRKLEGNRRTLPNF